LVKEGKVGNVRIIDKAIAPETPIKPKKSSIVGISALLGLLAGLGLAFLRNSLRPGIKNAEELEHRLGLNVFATIPLSAAQQQLDADTMAKKPGTHLLATLRPNEAAIESLRSLRTALQFAMLEAPNNIVLITGPTPNIGKSFTAANFAAVLAAAGQRVLLIDADMRKGHVNQFFGLARGMGFSELVTGTQALDKVLHRNVVPGLDFITTGTMPPNPAELLMSPTTQALFKSLSAQYDLVLIDSPPVLAVSDTAILAPQAGTTFMVVRADVSSLGEVQEAVKRIAQSGETVKGIIFNGLDISKRRYGYGYGYGYGYKYKRYGYRYQSYNYGQDNKGK
jgi:tyrosine-protein kinase Etk/Wzc